MSHIAKNILLPCVINKFKILSVKEKISVSPEPSGTLGRKRPILHLCSLCKSFSTAFGQITLKKPPLVNQDLIGLQQINPDVLHIFLIATMRNPTELVGGVGR